MGFTNNQLLGRYSPITPGLSDLETTNNPFDGNIRTVWSNNLSQEVRTGTETGIGILRTDLELDNNGTIYAGRSKINELGFTHKISKDNFGQSYDQRKISGNDNLNFKFSQNTVHGGFSQSDAPMLSTNTSSDRIWMVRDDEITDTSTARDELVDQQDIRKQKTFFDIEHLPRDSNYGCSPAGLGSDSGTENGRSSSSMGSLEKGGNKMDKQQEGNGGHFLRSSVFRNTLHTIGNEGDSDKIGQLFDSIQSQKTEGSTTTSIWSQESIQDNPTFESIADSLSRLDSSGDYRINPQLVKILFLWWDLEPTLDLFQNQYNAILSRYVSTDPRDSNAQWIGAFNHTWENEILWIHPHILMISQILITLKLQQFTEIVVVPWWPGQPRFTTLLQENQRRIILGPSNRILPRGPSMIAKRQHLPPGKIAAILIITQRIEDMNYQQSSQVLQDYQGKHTQYQWEDK
ncbi:MAG: hypothetical protein EZS28_044223, partial [Streblomastix strix]